jgi:hypothetical protein
MTVNSWSFLKVPWQFLEDSWERAKGKAPWLRVGDNKTVLFESHKKA